MTPAALACAASTVAIATVPVATAEVVRVTVRPSWPAFFSRNLACWMSPCAGRTSRVVEVRVVRGEEVVGDHPVAVQGRVDQLRAVNQQPHRLPDVDVVERRLIDAHRERDDLAGVRHDRLDAAAGGQGGDLRPVQRAGPLDDAGAQRILQGGVVAEVDDRQRVHVGQPRLPVVRVAGEDAALARREALVHERPGADRLGRAEAVRRDVQVVPERGQLLGEAREGLGQPDQDRVRCPGPWCSRGRSGRGRTSR